jgi:hypothetical protein
MQAPLGEFEVVVLMAVLHLGDEAHGSSVRDEIERRLNGSRPHALVRRMRVSPKC